MEKNRRDPITGELDDPLGDWANEGPADPPADRPDGGSAAAGNDLGGDGGSDTPRDRGPGPEDEQIGYRRPPPSHRFKKGQSGNPKGRRKGVKNEATILGELLQQKMRIRIDGRTITVTVREAILMRFREGALKGDIKSAAFIFDRENKHASDNPEQPEINQDDQAVIEEYLRKALRARKGEGE